MVQSVLGMIMDAITIGIVFARISHPKQRGRTIAISDSAVVARRDGILKFMFRIADIRRTQVTGLLLLQLGLYKLAMLKLPSKMFSAVVTVTARRHLSHSCFCDVGKACKS